MNLVEKFSAEMTGLIFSVAQFSEQAISEIQNMDVRQFYRLVSRLEERADKQKT